MTTRREPDTLWYKDAIIYQAHVRSFFDGNHRPDFTSVPLTGILKAM